MIALVLDLLPIKEQLVQGNLQLVIIGVIPAHRLKIYQVLQKCVLLLG